MRDRADNCVIICSIENVDPMGVHTGDSITVAPAQTLTDVEYQQMRDAAFACIRRVGVETGGSNVQFAVDPATGRQVVIEMNPRVSRSSALASKATGFPIAKIAAKLAVGYTLDEIPNDITKATPASFEPVIDYVVTKIPRWAFEKLPGTTRRPRHADAVRRRGDGDRPHVPREPAEGAALARAGPARPQLRPGRGSSWRRSPTTSCWRRSRSPTPDRIFQVGELLRRGVDDRGDPRRVPDRPVVPRPDAGRSSRSARALEPTADPTALTPRGWRRAKRLGFADAQLAYLWGIDEADGARRPRGRRRACRPTRRSTRAPPSSPPRRRTTTRRTRTRTRCGRPTGRRSSSSASGPNRIGQGIEFDYCCVHASFALREAGLRDGDDQLQPGDRVSTDYDTSDRLYFEPLTHEDVLNVIAAETAASRRRAAEGDRRRSAGRRR